MTEQPSPTPRDYEPFRAWHGECQCNDDGCRCPCHAESALADSATGPLDVERLAEAARQVFGGKPPGWEAPPTAPYQQRAESAFRHLANDLAAEYAHLASQSSGETP